MTLLQLFREIRPFVKPYYWLVSLALLLTLIGSLTAQVNAWVLRYTVDKVNVLIETQQGIREGFRILGYISIILIGKEIINAFIQFGQKYYGEKLRINISRDLAQRVIERILTYKMAFFSSGGEPGRKITNPY